MRGVVQGVRFRPFVYRLVRVRERAGRVANDEHGVEVCSVIAMLSIDSKLHGLCQLTLPAVEAVK